MSSSYLEYLKTRSGKAFLYRKFLVYPRLKHFLPVPAIDIGCGIGDMLKCYPDILGLDYDKSVVEYCRERGYKALHMNENQLPLPNESQQSVLLDNVIEHIYDPKLILSEVYRVLKNDGYFVVGVPGKFAYSRDPDHKVFYTPDKLISTITNAGFIFHKIIYSPFKLSFLIID